MEGTAAPLEMQVGSAAPLERTAGLLERTAGPLETAGQLVGWGCLEPGGTGAAAPPLAPAGQPWLLEGLPAGQRGCPGSARLERPRRLAARWESLTAAQSRLAHPAESPIRSRHPGFLQRSLFNARTG